MIMKGPCWLTVALLAVSLKNVEAFAPARSVTLRRTVPFQTSTLLFSSSSPSKEATVVKDSETSKSPSAESTSSDDDLSSSLSSSRLAQFHAWTGPIQSVLDDATGGWALSYADLSPETPSTPLGQAFLATNLAYLLAGVVLTYQGEAFLGFLTDLCAIASFNYHYQQLQTSRPANQVHADERRVDSAVRLSLLVDYIFAALSILTAFAYVVSDAAQLFQGQDLSGLPSLGLALGAASVGLVFLGLSWKYEHGKPYMAYHSVWHLCSAVAGYLIGSLPR